MDGLRVYEPRITAGKICYYISGKSVVLPIRDLLNELGGGCKREPNYETETYNYYKSCNQRSLKSALNRGVSEILFVTRYNGVSKSYQNKYFITGMYKIGWTGTISGRLFVKASKMAFVSVEDAYEITPARWKIICPTTIIEELSNLRFCTQTLNGDLLQEVTSLLIDHNVISDYILKVKNYEE